ncbi:hypothetical protein QBC40DRAFT_277389 [Triangularia verruculosa]|uniref:CYTH domain-containing protein n=1 Tax=Triangularia verruculosa TaxID=2587418 RepID=A0AAN7AUR2_9PEZI|nr:hypothetical protein QBC40DRAFT_277389 [Triangularia verruculosa]
MADANSTMTPDFEVKFLLNNSQVLDSGSFKPNDILRAAFNLPEKPITMNVQFLDTPAKEIYNAGWSPRIRKIEGESGYELTFKKRYPIIDHQADGAIDAGDLLTALNLAKGDGFDATETKYDAQVEWGFEKQTLSISRKKKVKKDSVGKKEIGLPDEKESRKLLIEEVPGKFDDWSFEKWGRSLLSQAVIYGPVLAERYEGTWEGVEVDIEVWPLRSTDTETGIENIVEVSFKSDNGNEAGNKHTALGQFLKESGWLVPGDSLKTQLIMDRYGPQEVGCSGKVVRNYADTA